MKNAKEKAKLMSNVGSLLLLITAIIWGLAFVAQQKGMESMGPFTFNSVRSFVAILALSPLLILNRRKIFVVGDGDGGEVSDSGKKRKLIFSGILSIGFIFTIATTSQQIGIGLTDNVGKAGFITALYIVLVPVAGVFLKKKPKWIIWICVAAATFGLYLLCIQKNSGFRLEKGDLLIIACAVLFTFHILLVDYFSARLNGLLIAVSQFFMVGVLCGIGMILVEKPTLSQLLDGLLPILYAGVLSSGVGYTLQIIGQKYVEPTKASLLMCLESVFSVLGGWLILHQKMTLREGIGCIIMFAAIIVSQVFGSQSSKSVKSTQE